MPKAMVEFACAFEAYRALGFVSEEIFLGYARKQVFAVLRTQGLEFSVGCGPIAESPAKVEALYQQLAKELPEWPEDEFRVAWEGSFVFQNSVALVAGLLAKGFRLPRNEP